MQIGARLQNPRWAVLAVGAAAISAAAVLAGCNVVHCQGFEPSCDGTVSLARCETECTGGAGKLDPPKECHEVRSRFDCATLGQTCLVLEVRRANRDEVQRASGCFDPSPRGCDEVGTQACLSDVVAGSCVQTTTGAFFLDKYPCAAGLSCHQVGQAAGCVSAPPVECSVEAMATCIADAGIQRCSPLARHDNPYYREDGPAFFIKAACPDGKSCVEADGGLGDGGRAPYTSCY